MKITFLVGNGFDIHVGLKTRYSDFYNYCLEKHADICKSNCILEKETSVIKIWSDLEMDLGDFIPSSDVTADIFYDDKEEVEELLVEYLEIVCKESIIIEERDETRSENEMYESIAHFYEFLKLTDKERVKNTINSIGNPIEYSAISFNYTVVFDRFWKLAKDFVSRGSKQGMNNLKFKALHAYLWVKTEPKMSLPCTITMFSALLPACSEAAP